MTAHPNGFAAVTKAHREAQGLTQEKFAEALLQNCRSQTLPQTRQGVSLWEQGKTEPMLEDLFWIMLIYSDWRMQWAIDAICAKMPEVFARDQFGLVVLKETSRPG